MAARSGFSTTSRRCTRWRTPWRADAHLFAPRTVRYGTIPGYPSPGEPGKNYGFAAGMMPAYKQTTTPDGETKVAFLDAGENPPNGVAVFYRLSEKPAKPITLTFLDAAGREIRSFTSRRREQDASVGAPDEEPRLTKNAGANRFVWNLRSPDVTRLPDNKGRGGTAEMLAGPRMPPGSYQARLAVGGRTLTQPFEVVKDPRVQATDEDLREQFTWAKKAYDLLKRVHDAVLTLRDARAQAEAGGPGGVTSGQGGGTGARAEADSHRGGAHPGPVGRPAHVPREAEFEGRRAHAPRRVLRQRSDAGAPRARRQPRAPGGDGVAKLDRCLAEDVVAFNAACRAANLPAILPRPRQP